MTGLSGHVLILGIAVALWNDRAVYVQSLPNAAPEIVILNEDTTSVEGTMLILTCVGYSVPSPGMMWQKDGVELSNNSRVSIYSTEVEVGGISFVQASLEICSTEQTDKGTYSCTATNEEGSNTLSFRTSVEQRVPLKPPENFQATAGEREVTFSWSTPSISAPITGYNLSCSPSPSSLPRSFTLSGMYTMTGFYPNTVYNCSLVSYNSYNTMRSAVIFTTLTSDHEDYSLFQIVLKGLINCPEWVADNVFSKHGDIVSAIVDELNENCICGIESSDVDERSFVACDEQLHEYVTFRAKLSGTSDKSSEYLITLLEEWVLTGPVIIVEGVLVKVENNELSCSTVLSDFKEKSCLKEYESSTDSSEGTSGVSEVAKIGASVATIVGTLLAIFTAFWGCMFWYWKKKQKEKKERENSLPGVSNSTSLSSRTQMPDVNYQYHYPM